MSNKRARPTEPERVPRSKRPKVDTGLAKIWESLADEDEEVRLQAAYELVTNHCKSSDLEQATVISKRLFRGLCSSRKSARLGFYLALVGALSVEGKPFGTSNISLQDVVTLLEVQTTPEVGTSGQDERDHYFGRLLACKALLETDLLVSCGAGPDSQWSKLFDIICALMEQKPWLRSEGASIICSAIHRAVCGSAYSSTDRKEAPLQAFRHLQQYKLSRTIDGVRIWLYLQEELPKAKLPHDIWSSDGPLTVKELPMLKRALLDTQSSEEDKGDILGTSVWSPRLHDAWTLIFRKLSKSQVKGQVALSQFWQAIVEDGLFSPSATPERKFTGFLVLREALKEVTNTSIPALCSKNVMASMIQALRSSDTAYLQKVIHGVFSALRNSVDDGDAARVEAVIEGLLIGSDFADFDTLTKTKILASLFELVTLSDAAGLGKRLVSWLQRDPRDEPDPVKVASRRKNILSVLQRALCQSFRKFASAELQGDDADGTKHNGMLSLIRTLLHMKQIATEQDGLSVPYDEGTRTVLSERLQQILEALLSVPSLFGQLTYLEVVAHLETEDLQAEEGIRSVVQLSWKHFNKQRFRVLKQVSPQLKSAVPVSKPNQITPEQGLILLLATLLYETYDGDSESIELLEDANSMVDDFNDGNDEEKVGNHIIDIILSFMSRSSKFHRRVGSMIFEAFGARMSRDGLQSLIEILNTKEGREGQLELFENGDVELDDAGSEEEAVSSETGSMDSDVEVLDAADGVNGIDDNASGSSSGEDTDESESDDEEGSVEDEELIKFESALAAALGTRKLTKDDLDMDDEDDSDTASDMSDSQMIELDSKLAEVFKNQHDATSAQKVRKEELKSAKENVVNLKNRAVDLIELFLRSQQVRGIECVELLGVLLQMVSTTGSQQLANRATGVVKNYVQKAKGAKLPKVPANKETRDRLLHQLKEIHKVVMRMDATNSMIDVAGQLNILVCKLLLEAGEISIHDVVNAVCTEAGSRTDIQRKAMQDFWSRYDAWTHSLQERTKEVSKSQSSVTKAERAKQQSGTGSLPKKKKEKKEVHTTV